MNMNAGYIQTQHGAGYSYIDENPMLNSFLSVLTCFSAQKNHLIEMVSLSTYNICFE